MFGLSFRSNRLTFAINTIQRFISQSYYDILKVPHSCSTKDVREAFINLSKKNHPDKHGNDPSMHDRFVQINEAYSVLINPVTRRAYDVTLSSKKKLNAPHPVYTSTSTYGYGHNTNQGNKQYKSTNNSYSSSSGTSGDHYFYTSWEKRNKWKGKHRVDESYYGIKGVKKQSNSTIFLFIVAFTLIGGLGQWFAIRAYSKFSKEKIMEKSRKLNLIHAMAREKAKLYGNDYQLNVLKSTLKSSYEFPDDVESFDNLPEIVVEPTESCESCNNRKQI